MNNFLKSFLTGKNKVRDCARDKFIFEMENKHFPVKLIEPSTGIIVKLEVTEQNDHAARMYMNQLIKYVEFLEQYGTQWNVTGGGKTMEIIFIDDNMAENVRQTLKKMM